jgi:hypothetical protein
MARTQIPETRGEVAPPETPKPIIAGAGLEREAREAREATEEVGEAAVGAAERVKERTGQALAGQKDYLAGQVESIAHALRRTAATLRVEGQDAVAGFADRAAGRLAGMSSSVRENDTSGLIRRAEDFARREPALFLGGAVALGLAIARMLKSSERSAGR